MIEDILKEKKFTNIPEIKQDKKGRITYIKTGDIEKITQYDSKGRVIFEEQIMEGKSRTNIFKYDSNDNLIYMKKDDYQERRKFVYIPKKNIWKIKKQWNDMGMVKQYKYYPNGLIRWGMDQLPDGYTLETSYKYDRKGRTIMREQSDGFREKWEYINDKYFSGERHYDSDGKMEEKIFDKLNKTEIIKNIDGTTSTAKRDKKGVLIYSEKPGYKYYKEGEKELQILGDQYYLNGILLTEDKAGE